MANASVIGTAKITFGSTEYKVKSLPAGKPQSCAAVDVTTLSDTRKKKAPGAVKTNGEITVVVAGSAHPAQNAKAALTITLDSATVACGDAVVKSVTPDGIEASGNSRELKWTVVFQPCGAAPSATV